MRGGLIVVRAGEGLRVEAYDNLDLLVLLHQGKRTKKKQGYRGRLSLPRYIERKVAFLRNAGVMGSTAFLPSATSRWDVKAFSIKSSI